MSFPSSSLRARRALAPRRVVAGGLAALLTGAACAVGVGTMTTAHADDEPVGSEPLSLRLDEVTPSVLDAGGSRPVRLTGTITNVSDETWTAVNVAPFRSQLPITDPVGLAAAADTAVTEYVGDRLTAVESLTTIDSLAPGETAAFSTLIPRSALSTQPGVYWVGVHALGETATQPRDTLTDGRARTFLPVASSRQAASTALVLPVRREVARDADGRLTAPGAWRTALKDGGDLAALLEAGRAVQKSNQGSVASWLVDPAVPHAVAQLAAGNPGWRLAPSDAVVAHLGEDATEPQGASETDEELADLAADWLETFTALLRAQGSDVRALPYGDVDVAALSRQAPAAVRASQERGLAVMEALEVTARPAVAPPEGSLPEGTIKRLLPDTLVLLSDRAVVGDDSAPVPVTGIVAGHRFVTTSAGVTDGGPGPEASGTALAVRQRTVSEAAVRRLSGDSSPLVVMPPDGWEVAAGTNALMDLVEEGNLRATTLTQVAAGQSAAGQRGSATSVLDPTALGFGDAERALLVPRANVKVASAAYRRASVLEAVLARPAGIDQQVRDATWTALSYAGRSDVPGRRAELDAISTHVADLVGEVDITGPKVVTLSGSSGRFGATVSNGLDVPVRVNVQAVSGDTISLEVPNPVRIAPDSRHRILIQADRAQQGVSSVTLKVTTIDGTATGAEDRLPVRSSQVSGFLWLVIGGGAAVLFGAIVVRFYRRGLASRREQGVA